MPSVTRAQLKSACANAEWDLLDKLLELDKTHIDDKSYFTDTWGEWWGLLFSCVLRDEADGVRVLLKHGADRTIGNWGDCIPTTPLSFASDVRQNAEIVALLTAEQAPAYVRKTDPPLPAPSSQDERVNRQGDIRDATGLVFPVDEEA